MTATDSPEADLTATEQAPQRHWREQMFAPFKHKLFAAIWTAALVSNFGSVIQSVGASWLMTSIAPTPDMVALVQVATTAPIMILSLVGGALADTLDRRFIMLAAQIFVMIVSLLLAVLAALNMVSPWALLGLTFLIGCGGALYAPAWQSSVSDMVAREDIAQAVSLNSIGFNIARSVAPALGGLLIAWAGPEAAFGLNALSYIALITVLFRWKREPDKSTLPRESLGRAIYGGMRYVSMSPPIIAVLVRALSFGLCGAALWALMPLVARDILKGGPLVFGAMFGFFGVGSMAAALLSSRIRAQFRNDGIVNYGTLGFAFATAIAALSTHLVLTLPMMMVAGASWILSLSTFNVSVQMSSPRWVSGRTLSFYQVASMGGLAIGAMVWGHVANGFGLTPAMCLAAIIMTASSFLGLRFKMPGSEVVDLAPWTRRSMLDPVLDVHAHNGPIATTIEYRVEPSKAAEFVVAMRELARIRKRDGARNWRLSQDLDDPEIWAEHYSSPTWSDHLRRMTRPTVADDWVRARVNGMIKPGTELAIRRRLERQVDEPLAAPPQDPVHGVILEQ